MNKRFFERYVSIATVLIPIFLFSHVGEIRAEKIVATTDADALSKARTIGNKNRAELTFYEPVFDLSDLPEYTPERKVSGVIRQWGNNYLKDSGLMKLWEDGFKQYHPDITFENSLASSSVGIPGLIAGKSDLSPMGRQALWDELKGLERQGGSRNEDVEAVEIIMATGSFNVRGWTFALGIFVHKDNPISELTIEQLDGILGAERSGGWKGLTWDTSVARGADKNIRTWGELGLKGEWKDRPINVYGYNAKYHFNDEIDKKILKGSGKWNEKMAMYSNMAGFKKDGSLSPGGELMMEALGGDRFGITYTGIPFMTNKTKALALADSPDEAAIPLTLKTVRNRTYPLIRDVYYYLLRIKGKPIDPKLKEFLRYVLSREAQQAVQIDGKYLPLTAEVVYEQLRILE